MIVSFVDEKFNVKEYPQYESISHPYSLQCVCLYATYLDSNTYKIVGYCNTRDGYMGVFECRKCHELYRHHIGMNNVYDLVSFKKNIGLIYFNQQFK